jgi:copper transport protein
MGIEQDLLRVSFTLVRFAAFAANALLFGAIPLLMLVLRPALQSLDARSWRPGRMQLAVRLEGLLRASLVASAAATVLALFLQTALVSSLDEGDLGLDALETVLSTTFGIWSLIRLPVLGALSVLLYKRVQDLCLSGMAPGEQRAGSTWWGLWGLLSLVLLATWSFAGHAAVSNPAWAALTNDVVHLAAGATWFAGIVILSVTLPDVWQNKERLDRLRVLSAVVSRFSRLALIAIAVIAATGTINSIFNLESPGDLVDSGYGITLTIKIVLFLGVVVLGAVNHLVVRRRLRDAAEHGNSSDPYALFRKTIAAELVVGLLIVGSTGLLVGLNRTREIRTQSAPLFSSEWGPDRSS